MKTTILKYLLLTVLFFISCKETFGQDQKNSILNSKIETDYVIPKDQKIVSAEEIDFDGDSIKETIITTSDINANNFFEYWIKNKKLIYKFTYPWASINKKWLVNLDEDQQNEIIRANGFEDGINYTIYDIQNGKQIPVLFFNPVLNDDDYPNQNFWAYPNDIRELDFSNGKIRVSVDNNFQREGDYYIPKDQKELPFVFFHGTASQPDMKITDLNKPTYFTLQSLKNYLNSTTKINKKSILNGTYEGFFLRLKEESADPRAWGKIKLEINDKKAKLNIDSYVENINKNLTVVSVSPSALKLNDESGNHYLLITKIKDIIQVEGTIMDSIIGTKGKYEIKKINE